MNTICSTTRLKRTDALSVGRFDRQLGPYSFADLRVSPGPFAYLQSNDDRYLTLFGFGREQFDARRATRATAFESIRGGLVGAPLKNVYIYGQFVLDEQKADDPAYTGKKWRGLAGDVEDAFAVYATNRLNITVGRFGSFWGMRESLILGAEQKLDGLAYSIRWGRLRLSYRLARLNPLHVLTDSVSITENRYFAGHRLDIHLSDDLRVGAFETIIFGGEGRQIEFAYLNPLLFYHGTQLNDSTNDNALIGIDFDWKPLHRMNLFGQLVVDDWQIDNQSQGDQEPNEFGLLVGGFLADLLPETDAKLTYIRVTNRTYNQILPRNRYINDGGLLSSPQGNDFDNARLEIRHWLSPLRYLRTRLSFLRQGEGSVDDPWTQPWLDITGPYHEPFPTGVVETSTNISLGGKGVAFDHLYFDIDAGLSHIKNDGHVAGANRTSLFASICLSVFGFTSIPVD